MADYAMQHTGAELDEAIGRVLDGYRDVSAVTARAKDVWAGKVFVTPAGPVTGTYDPGDGIIFPKLPDDGLTRIVYYIPKNTPANRMTAYLRVGGAPSIDGWQIEWGDGAVTPITSGPPANFEHTYTEIPEEGYYIQTISRIGGATDGSVRFGGDANNAIYGPTSGAGEWNRLRIRWVSFGDRVLEIGKYAFYNCAGLMRLNFPSSPAIFPNTIGQNAFNCTAAHLDGLTIPEGVTTLGPNAFQNALTYSEGELVLPASLTRIGSGVFYGLNVFRIRFKSATPPAVAAASAFTGLTDDVVISVPTGSLEAYTTAPNYPDSTRYTYIEED